MTTSELAKALAAVQEKLPAIAKGETGKVEGVSKATGKPFSYEYKYADLADVSDAILPLLGKNGLAFTAWPTLDDDGRFVLAYALLHESGEERTGVYPLPSSGTPQDIGKAITYARRYALCAVTGAAPGGDDNDAAEVPEVHMDRGRTTARPPSDVPSRPVVPGPRPGPELEQLRAAIRWAPEDKPTEHGPIPPGEDHWQDVPEQQHGSAQGTDDVRKIQMAYQALGFTRTDRAQVIKISEQLVNRPLTGPNPGHTHNNLSLVEARKLKDTLEAFQGDRGLLMERLTGIRQAAAAVTEQDAAEASQEDPVPP